MATDAAEAQAGGPPEEAGGPPEEAGHLAREAARSTTLRRGAQFGLAGYAGVHLLVAWLAVQLAWRIPGPAQNGGRATDQTGALLLLSRSPAGQALLWALAASMAGLATWQAVEVLRHHRHLPPAGRERWRALLQLVKTVGTALLYAYLGLSAVRTALGHHQGRGHEQHTVRGVLSWPGGQALVVAVAAVTAGIGVYLAVKGFRSGFLDEIDLDTVSPRLSLAGRWVCQAGFVLKGAALVLVGAVVAGAAITFDPARADGLDGALRTVAGQPYGQWALTVIAAGLAAFAGYCLLRARHPVG